MKRQIFSSVIASSFSILVLASQVSCKSGGSGSSSGSTYSGGSKDYPFDENGNYRPEFLAAHGGGGEDVVDLTKDNPRSKFIGTASNDGWKVASTGSKPKVTTSTTRSKPTPVSKPKPTKTVAVSKPKPKPAPAPKASYGSHSVAQGDTLFSLAKRYGTSVGAIQSANGLGGSTNLKLASSLKIPKK